jgi:hypothetical protein
MSFIITCMPVIRKIVAIKSATKIALLAIYIYIYIYGTKRHILFDKVVFCGLS